MRLRKSLFAILLFFSIIFLSGINKVEAQDKIIDIVDCRGKEYPKPDYKTHEFKDLEIYRFEVIHGPPDITGGFDLLIWGKENDSLQRYGKFVVFSNGNFTQATYRLDADTILLIRLYNPELEEDLNLHYWGNIFDLAGRIQGMLFHPDNPRKEPKGYVGVMEWPKKR